MTDDLQRVMAPEDVPAPTNLPPYWKSRLEDIEAEISTVRKGAVAVSAVSPGGLPVYTVSYGEQEGLHSQANYNSAVAAGNPAYYALKTPDTKAVSVVLGPVHGQEFENIVGTVNLIHVLETGADHRGKKWDDLRAKADRCRLVIVPCGNPDGRRRSPYDSFVGLPHPIMTKYGQGTRTDGTMWGWPGAKANHPMKGDVDILGCYYNDDGINMMHDDFFGDMAQETRALIGLARAEAPDFVLSLHSNEDPPFVVLPAAVPLFIRRRAREFARRLKARLRSESLPNGPIHRLSDEDGKPLPRFNLNSAIHYVCGATALTFECIHGVVRSGDAEPPATHDQILDIQLCLFDEMLTYTLERRIYWNR